MNHADLPGNQPQRDGSGIRRPVGEDLLRFAVTGCVCAALLSGLLAAALEVPATVRVWEALQDPPTRHASATAGVFLAFVRWIAWLLLLAPALMLRAVGWRRMAASVAVLMLAAGTAANGAFIVLAERTGVRWTENIEAAFAPGALDLIGGFEVLQLSIWGCFAVACGITGAFWLAVRALVKRLPPAAAAALPVALVVVGLLSWWTVRPVMIAAARPVVLLSSWVELPMPPRPAEAAGFDRRLNQAAEPLLKAAAAAIEAPTTEVLPPPPPDPPVPPPDVVVIVNETFRRDAFQAELMPRLRRRAEAGLVGTSHRSSGNASELGIYGLLRARVPAVYDLQVAKGPQPSALTRLGRSRGYHTAWLSGGYSADFKGLENVLTPDSFDVIEEGITGTGDTYADADEQILRRVAAELDGGDPHRLPRLILVFGMSLHYPYGTKNPWHPWAPDDPPRWAESFEEGQRESVVRYANSVARLDAALESFLATIDLDRTVVVITGDHGEAFRDDGLEGHAGAPSDAQSAVPLVVLGPGVPAREILVPTSHVDLVATLAHLIDGTDRPIGHGRSLLADLPPDRAVLFAALGQRHPYDLDRFTESSLIAVGADAPARLFLRFTAEAADRPPRLRVQGWVTPSGLYSDTRPPPLEADEAADVLRAALRPLLGGE